MGDTSQVACNLNDKIKNEINTENTNEINKNLLSLNNVTNKRDNTSFYTEVISIDDSDDEGTEPKCNQDDISNEIAASSGFLNENNSPSKSENEKEYYIIYQHKLYILSRETILKGIEEQAKLVKNKSDTILNKIIRTQHPQCYTHKRTVYENLIYNAIEYWKRWCESTKLKTTPILYKCYICSEGWSRLYHFEQHITIHEEKNLTILLEVIGQETNIIVSYGNPKKSELVIVNTDCWKCNKVFQNREFMKYCVKSHTCELCLDQLTSVGSQSDCKSFNDSGVLCNICSMKCKNGYLYSHMVLYHSPKSDEPAITHPKICNICEEKYFFLPYHDCQKKYKFYRCQFCWNRFLTKRLQQLHILMNKGVSECPDCSKKFTKCYLNEHLLAHSSNYDVLQYCILCKNNVLYNNNELFTSHMVKHGKSSQRRRYAAKMLLPFKCIKGVICDSIVRLQVPAKILHKYIVDLEYMNYTPLELFEIIKSKKTKEITEACNKSNTNKTTSVNKCRNLEQSVITKILNKKQIITRTVNNLQDDIDFDVESNNAFQVQLDAEIQRDVEIEKQISKVFEASDCYKKFLDKEANDPIDDTYDVLDNTVSNNDEYLNTDTSTEENSDTDIQNENQSDMEYSEIFKCNIKTNVDKMEDCDSTKEKSKQEVNESIKEIEKENINKKDTDLINLNITEDNLISKDSGNEIEKSDITKDFNDKVTSDYLNAIDNLDTDIKTDPSINIKIDTLNIDIDGISDNIVPKYSDNYIEINTENISEPKYYCSDCKYTGNYKQYVDHSISCINKHINCIYCMKSFQNIKSFLTHFPEHKLTYLSCPQCFEKFNNILNLKNHILTHIYELFHLPNTGYKDYKCSLCEESVDIDNFFIHWESHLQLNEGNMDIDNEIELKKIMTPEMVKQALVILTKIRNHNLLCIVCSKMFTNSIKLKRHLINHLLYEVKIDMLNGAKLTCPKCRIDIKDIDNWIIHMKEHSHLHRIYFCKSCRKSYKDPILFDQHKGKHKKKYVCDICDKKFFVKSLIIQHLENHEPVKIITCQICDEVFRFQSQYKSHDCMPLLRFSCTLCESKFRTCKDKLNHLWNKHKFSRHSADCTLCDKKYRRLLDLRCHMKMKHGIKRSDEFDRLREQSTTKGKKKKRQEKVNKHLLHNRTSII